MIKLNIIGLDRISEIIRRLDEADTMVRDEIRAEVDSTGQNLKVSSRVASLVRCRADLQSAITALLQCRCDTIENANNGEVAK